MDIFDRDIASRTISATVLGQLVEERERKKREAASEDSFYYGADNSISVNAGIS